MSDIFQEVDQARRDEAMQERVRKFAPYFVAGVAGLLLVTIGVNMATERRQAASDTVATDYLTALDDMAEGRVDAARAAFTRITQSGVGAYPLLAGKQLAALDLQVDDRRAAAEALSNAANTLDDPLYSDLALLKSAYARADALNFSQLEALLQPVLGEERPYRLAAQELLAVKALEENDLDRARRLYAGLGGDMNSVAALQSASRAPQEMQRRATEAVRLIDTLRQPTTADRTTPSTPVPPAGDDQPSLDIRGATGDPAAPAPAAPDEAAPAQE